MNNIQDKIDKHTKKYSAYFYQQGLFSKQNTLQQRILRWAIETPNNIAINDVTTNTKYTYNEFYNLADELSSGLLSLGLKKGDVVGICLPNIFEHILFQTACAFAGLPFIPLYCLATQKELVYQTRAADAVAVICQSEIQARFLDANNKIKHIVTIDEPKTDNRIKYNDLFFGKKYQETVNADDAYLIGRTSGTTSTSEIFATTHNMRCLASDVRNKNTKINNDDIVIFQGSYSSGVGNTVTRNTLLAGATVLITVNDYIGFCDGIKKEKATFIETNPIAIKFFYDNYNVDLSSVKAIIPMGQVTSKELALTIDESLPNGKFLNHWSMTETFVPIIQHIDDDLDTRLNWTGKHPLNLARIVNGNNEECFDTEGSLQIWAGCGSVKVNDSGSKTKLFGDWLNTGDLAIMNKHGDVRITGRENSTIYYEARQINPTEIETILNKHPQVSQSCLVGVKKNDFSYPVCFIVGDNSLGVDDINLYLKRHISIDLPYIEFIKEMPLTTTNKISKLELKKIADKIINSK